MEWEQVATELLRRMSRELGWEINGEGTDDAKPEDVKWLASTLADLCGDGAEWRRRRIEALKAELAALEVS